PPSSAARLSNIIAVRATADPERSVSVRLGSSLIAGLLAEGSSCSARKLSYSSSVQTGMTPLSHRRISEFVRNPGATTVFPSAETWERRIADPVQPRFRLESESSFHARGMPMDTAEILSQLTHAGGLPKTALQAASKQRAEIVPIF